MRIFDFRYPKPYHHFNALPCSDQSPCPETPEVVHARLSREGSLASGALPNQGPVTASPRRCEPGRRRVCRWHKQSMHPDWRPDATVFLGTDADDRVVSLAKASDLSDYFYCGLRGAMVEARAALTGDAHRETARPHPPPRWTVQDKERASRQVALLETGTSLCRGSGWLGIEPTRGMVLYHQRPDAGLDAARPAGSRLDASLRPC